MTNVSFTKARAKLSDLITRVVTGHERVVIERHGHEKVALVPLEDLDTLQRIEDEIDIAEAEAALSETDERIPWEEVKKDLGL